MNFNKRKLMDESIHFKCTKTMKEQLENLAKNNNVKLSIIVKTIIEDYLNKEVK